MTVFQECSQQFDALPIDAKKCRQLLAKLLRLMYHGVQFPSQESTKLFFSILKLFQHKDSSLRQLVYLAIKELSATLENILMVTSSIMKDIQLGDLIYKPNAIRTLSKVLDGLTASSAERLFRNCLVDKNPIVSSAALISSYNLLPVAKDVVKRFSNETMETINSYKQFPSNQFQLHEYYGSSTSNLPSNSYMYQYHALGLLYQLKSHDKMSMMKLITSLNEGLSLKNSLALIQLVRYINRVLEDDPSLMSHLYPILHGLLGHSSEMVELEACKTLTNLAHLIKDSELLNALTSLKLLLSAPRSVTRFAAVRLVNKVSLKRPELTQILNSELEELINDANRSVSILAITTLLRTFGAGAVESTSSDSVDRLILKMTSLMDEISEDFKIVIIEAIESLALKFPSKHKQMVDFLSELLTDDGSFKLKSAIVEALFDLIKFLPDDNAKQLILMNFCEFIEDCEYTQLLVRILHLLGDEGPKTSQPSYYIRHIYNRLVLENAIVRSSAIIALAKFGAFCEEPLSSNVRILLTRSLKDVDDEVRDRAALALRFIDSKLKNLVSNEFKFALAALENKLTHYLNDENNFSSEFEISEVPLLTAEELKTLEYNEKLSQLDKGADGSTEKDGTEKTSLPSATEGGDDDSAKEYVKQQEYAMRLAEVAEFVEYGKLSKSTSTPLYLTEKENEFVVTVVKHFFAETNKLVLQYDITNTLPSLVLQDVTIEALPDNAAYEEEYIFPLAELKPQQSGTVYISFSVPDILEDDILAALGNTLSYTGKDVIDDDCGIDPTDEGIQDDYQIEDLEVVAGDFIFPLYKPNFTAIYDQLQSEDSTVVTVIGVNTIENAVTKLTKSLSCMALEGTDYVPSDCTAHNLKLLGKDLWGGMVAVNVRFALRNSLVVAKIEVRAETEGMAAVVASGAY